jgi:AcrR family transcriptional regulator
MTRHSVVNVGPFVRTRVPPPALVIDAVVVDENVDAAKVGGHLAGERHGAVVGRKIRGDAHDQLPRLALNVLCHGSRFLPIASCHDNDYAFASEPACDGASNASRTAGDQRTFACQLQIHPNTSAMIQTGLYQFHVSVILTGLYNSVNGQKSGEVLTGKETPSPRDRLLETAGALFQRYGFQAVGIDRILAESGVAKMTLYRYFASKDEMIAAYLERADAQFWSWAHTAMEKAATPKGKLVALFEAVGDLASSPECLGCVFQGAAMAFPEIEHPSHQIAVRHKLAVRERLKDLAREAKLTHPEALGVQLTLLLDGVWIAARTFRQTENPAKSVTQAAKALIEAHTRARSQSGSSKRR